MYQSPRIVHGGAIRAILVAGPIFVILTVMAMLYQRLPEPIEIDPGSIIALFLLLGVSLIFGLLIACLPVTIGTIIMVWLSSRSDLLALRATWGITGLLIGLVTVHAMNLQSSSPDIAFALILTCGISAFLSHSQT